MSVWIKRGALALISLVVLLVAGVIGLVLLIDPNDLKPQLEKLAAEQGYGLRLEGDIGWQLFPRLGLSLGTLNLRELEGEQSVPPLLAVDNTSLSVAVVPLLSRRVEIDHITIEAPSLFVWVDSEGNLNIPATDAEARAEPPQTEAPASGADFQIAANTITVKDATLTYRDDMSQQTVEIGSLNLETSAVNNTGRPFPLSLSLNLRHDTFQDPLHVAVGGQVSFDQAGETLALDSGQVELTSGGAKAQLDTGLSVNFADALSARGQWQLAQLNPRHWLAALGQAAPDTANPDALTALSLSSEFSYDGNQLQLPNLQLALDQTQGSGELGVTLPDNTEPNNAAPKITATLSLDQLNLDDYLAPEPPPEQKSPAEQPASATDAALPLEAFHAADADLSLSLQQLVASGLTLEEIQTRITGAGGLWKLAQLSARFYQGGINATASIDARDKRRALMDINAGLDGVEILPLLTDLAEVTDVEGRINASVTGNTSASTTSQLMERLNASLSFNSDALRLHGMNLERLYCEMAHQLDDQDRPQTQWPKYSDIDTVTGTVTIANQQAAIQRFAARASNLEVGVTGGMNLAEQQYGLRFPLTLVQAQTSANGCLVESNFLLQRAIDVVSCQGSLSPLAPGEQCGLDKGALTDLTKQAVRYNAEKKIDPKKQELRESVKNKLRDSLGLDEEDKSADDGEEKKSTRDRLRDLLR